MDGTPVSTWTPPTPRVPVPRRALLSVSDKTGLVAFAEGLVRLGFELVSTGGTARTLRDAGLPVTDVAAVTGFPEMLDGRVKTLHPRVHGGILADRRLADHRRQLLGAAIAPFELVVVNLYPFAAAAERPGISFDALVEEIDIGGPSMVRAAAKNHANVAIVTSPARYASVLAAIDADGRVNDGLRAALAVEAFRHTAAYDARIAEVLPERMAQVLELPDEAGLPGSADPYPPSLTIALEKVESLRYGENPHQPAARYRRPGSGAGRRPVRDGRAAAPGQGAVIQQRARRLGRGGDRPRVARPGRGDRQAHQPVRRRRAAHVARGLAGRARRRSDLRLRRRCRPDPRDRPARGGGPASPSSSRSSLPPPSSPPPSRCSPRSRTCGSSSTRSSPNEAPRPVPGPTASIRTAGGAVLVTAPDTVADDPATWIVASRRAPTDAERADLDLAWRLVRGVVSNAIVLVRDGRLIGMGSGQTSRVDAARGAVDKARTHAGAEALRGASCASDAFYPFPDAIEVCLEAGVSAFVQPGGSMRDAEAVAAVDAAGAAMVMTGVRHFRH